ncbi:Os09g0352700 [Oryza sativa Japonica Group]|uniref:Os09g0352700 protein n=1 Tax=Oryza sativa subsp. japonica TaxID=39947 RepID=A0A0P0XKK8_ORYSJ|nr:Os09g0352700 [Oryza sativa Japonica Group]
MVSSSTVNSHLPCAGHSTTYLPETSRETGRMAMTPLSPSQSPESSFFRSSACGGARVISVKLTRCRSSRHPSSICQRENTLRRARRGTSRRSATRGGPRTGGKAPPPGSTTWKRWWSVVL